MTLEGGGRGKKTGGGRDEEEEKGMTRANVERGGRRWGGDRQKDRS